MDREEAGKKRDTEDRYRLVGLARVMEGQLNIYQALGDHNVGFETN